MLHKKIDFTKTGGFPLRTDSVLGFMQEGYSDLAVAMVAIMGNNVIISGVENDGTGLTQGWIIYDGELLPFLAGAASEYFSIVSEGTDFLFKDGNLKTVRFTKYATSAVTGIEISTLKRIRQYKELTILPDQFMNLNVFNLSSDNGREIILLQKYDQKLIKLDITVHYPAYSGARTDVNWYRQFPLEFAASGNVSMCQIAYIPDSGLKQTKLVPVTLSNSSLTVEMQILEGWEYFFTFSLLTKIK